MFRQLSQDPTPAELMRQRAPRLYVWVARMWEARSELRENARAHGQGRRHFEQEIQGCRYEGLPVSRYRVWCLEELRRLWRELDEGAQATVRSHLPEPYAAVLWEEEPAAKSDYDPERLAPFNSAINVFGTGVPS